MLPLILYGEHEQTMGDQNRLIIPAAIRKALDPVEHGEALFLIIGVNKKLWAYPELYYYNKFAKPSEEIVPDDDMIEFDQLNFSNAERIEWDKQGRVVLPDRMVKRTNLGREITIIGARDHIQFWNRDEWNSRYDNLESRRKEISDRYKGSQEKVQGRTLLPNPDR